MCIRDSTEPVQDHNYTITVDVARGIDKDYSAFAVFDTTTVPYKLVAKYKNSTIKPLLFPDIIYKVATAYNQAYVLVEVNDVGAQVSDILQFDLEYENLLMCAMRGRAGQVVGQGFSGGKVQLGVKMSSTVKKVGCSNLKGLIEDDKIIINDYDIISELTTFIQKGSSWQAEDGCNDDLAMCLVIFAWLSVQDYFKELHDNDVRKRMYEEQREAIDADMAPFGFISDGMEEETFVDKEGDVWSAAKSGDEYGERTFMWEYR